MPQREKNILSVCDEGDQPPPLHPLAHRHSGPPPRHQRHFTAESNTSEDHETVPSYRSHVESSRRCDVGNPQASTDDDEDREWDSEQDEGEDGILFSVFQSVSGRAAETLLVSSSTTAAEASGVDSDAYSTHVIDCGLTDMFQKVGASKVEAEAHHMLFDSLSEASTVSLERQQGVYHEELESQLRNLIQEMFEGIESPSRVREAAQLLDREGVVEYNVYRPPRGAHLQPRLSAMHLVEWGEARADRCSLFVTGLSVCPPQAPSPSGQSSRANSGHLVMKPPTHHHHHHHHHHSHRLASDLSIVGIPLRYPSALLQNATEESPFGGRVEEVLEIDGEVEEEEIFAMHADDDEPAVVDRREVPHQQRFVTDAQRLARGFPAVSPETVLEEDAREAEVIRVWETVCIPAIRERWDHLRRVAVVRGGALTKSLTAYIPIMSALLSEDLEPRDCRAPCTPPPAPGSRSRQSRLQRAKEKTPKQTKSGGRPVAHPPTGKDDPPTRQRKVSSQVNRFSCYMEPLPGREQGGKGGPENRSRSLDGAKERSRTQSPPPVVSTDPSAASLPVGVDVSNGKQPELGDGNVTSGALPGIPSRRRQTPTVRVMPNLNEAPPPMRGSGALALLLNRAQTALVRSTPHQPSRRL